MLTKLWNRMRGQRLAAIETRLESIEQLVTDHDEQVSRAFDRTVSVLERLDKRLGDNMAVLAALIRETNRHITERTDALVAQIAATRDAITNTEVRVMAGEQTILDRVRAQTTVIESIKAFVEELKANADDPAKTAEIIAALDANDLALAAVTNTPAAEPAPAGDAPAEAQAE